MKSKIICERLLTGEDTVAGHVHDASAVGSDRLAEDATACFERGYGGESSSYSDVVPATSAAKSLGVSGCFGLCHRLRVPVNIGREELI
jgi:hypothetical protein